MTSRCDAIRCDPPPSISHGLAISSDAEGSNPSNSSPNNNNPLSNNNNNFAYGSYVYYKCAEGYELNGNNLVQCDVTGQWAGSLPSCHMVSCGTVPVLIHASTIVSTTTYGSKAMYKCNRGYTLHGSEMVECLANGTWYPMADTECLPVDCGEPPTVRYSNTWYNSTALGARAEFECSTGYEISGSKIIHCREDGRWSNHLPQCRPVNCPRPIQPVNGGIEGSDYSFASEITYECDAGFNLIGQAVRRCQADATWSGSEPICTSTHHLFDL